MGTFKSLGIRWPGKKNGDPKERLFRVICIEFGNDLKDVLEKDHGWKKMRETRGYYSNNEARKYVLDHVGKGSDGVIIMG